jgi:hypothetical protein
MTWKTLKSNVKFVVKSKPFAASFVLGTGVLIGWVLGQIF